MPQEKPVVTKRGFAAMSPEKRAEIARLGGKKVSENRTHMIEIGRRGGQSVSQDRNHMAQIGAVGGEKSRKNTSRKK